MLRTPNEYSVVVPVFNNFKVAKQCIELIIENTPEQTQIIVVDDSSSEGVLRDYLKEFESRIVLIRNAKNLGFTGSVNIGFDLAGLNDVILVNSDVFVVNKWAERLHKDAYRSDLIATVTAMTDRGSIATVQIGDRNLTGCELSEISEISEYLNSLIELPPAVIPVGVGHCIYIKRIVLSQIGVFSEEFSPGYGEEVDFCMRAVRAGFIHTLSNSVIVQHLEGVSFGASSHGLKHKHELLIRKRYPQYQEYISSFFNHNDVQETIYLRAITYKYGIKVLIDGRNITASQSGTSIVSFEFAKYLSTSPDFHGTVKVLTNSENSNVARISNYVSQLKTHEINREINESGKFDIFFAPFQISNERFFAEADTWARRSMILQLDFIAFDNPFYHASIAEFRNYQKCAVLAGQRVDRILYNSDFVASESMRALQSSQDLSFSHSVVGNGLDHLDKSIMPSRKFTTKPQIGIIGTSFHHKNRIFALEIFRQLQDKFPGSKLHLIGATPSWGSSDSLEQAWLEDNFQLKKLVINHGGLSELEKNKVIQSLDLLLVPSVSEGFGLAPFDGLPFGVPSLFTQLHSTFEVLPEPPVHLSLLDAAANLEAIEALLTDDEIRTAQLQYLNDVKESFTWALVGAQVGAAMQQVVLELPRTPKSVGLDSLESVGLNVDSKLRKIGSGALALKLLPMGSNRRKLIHWVVTSRKRLNKCYLIVGSLRARMAFDKAIYAQQLQKSSLPTNLGYKHFRTVGWRARLNPNKWFETHYYLEKNPDVEQAGQNPLLHYFTHGKREGRLVNYPKGDEAFIRSGKGTQVEISGVSSDYVSRIFVKAGRNCKVIIKGIEVLETSLTINMSDNCNLTIESGQRIRGPLVINLNESTNVTIGKDCLFATSKIYTGDEHSIIDVETGRRTNIARDVSIGSNVWLATDALILKGSQIGSGSIIGAHSVVSGVIPENSAVAGNPGRVVKQNISWDQELL